VVAQTGPLTAAALTLDRTRQEVHIADQPPIRLTALETKMLDVLMRHPGQVVTTESLMTAVWGAESADRTMLKQLIYRLRHKLQSDAAQSPLIETVPGIGYTFPNNS
jgi:DNA-binding response OmpR family regulator